jgi:hypothetical protein
MKNVFLTVFLILIGTTSNATINQNNPRDYYVIQIYHCTDKSQISNIDAYLKSTYLPHLHAAGISKVGVFEPIDNDSAKDKRLMVWFPLQSINDLDKLDQLVEAIDPLGNNPLIHLENADSSLPYSRIETILTKAFKNQAQFVTSSDLVKSADRIYEFRSYEGPTEDMYLRKQHMFNEGNEIELFKKLNFNAIFYSKVIAGSRIPNLIYMTSFNNLEDRNAHWKTFGEDPTWKYISNLPQYLKTVSKADIILMTARDYADF